MSRIVEFADGYESSTAPESGAVQATALKSFPNDAAYVADKGSAAAEGDTYWNSTDDQPKYYTGAAWVQGVTTAGAQTIGGNKTFSNDVVIAGDLTVQGTTTTLNTATLDVEDANITVNKGGNVASANAARAGIEVELSDAAEAGVGFDSTSATKFKIGEVGSQSPIVSESATQTITGKTIDDDNNVIQNVAVTALKTVIGNALKFLSFDALGAPISTKAVPTGAVVGTTDTQVLTLKDYDGGTASNTNRTTLAKESTTNLTSLTRKQGNIFYDTTKNKPVFDDGTNLNEMGGSGGSGSGRVNNLDSNDANLETSIGNWVAFDDGASLVDGSGGSPTVIAVTRNTTAPLASTGDLKIAHSAANGLGEGVSVPFTSRNADKSSVQEISFDYFTTSGYADDVMELWIYDVTNTALISVTPYKLKASATPTKFKAFFQNHATSTSYRLIFFCNSTSATAFDIQADNFLVGPPNYNYGLVGSDPKEYSLVIGATTTAPTLGTTTLNRATWARNGKYALIQYQLTQTSVGTSGSGAYLFPLPPGMQIDPAYFTASSNAVDNSFGSAGIYTVDAAKAGAGLVKGYNATNMFLAIQTDTNALTDVGSTFFALGTASAQISFTAMVPILGWSSNVQLSDESDLRVTAATYGVTSGASTSSANPINFETKLFDTHGAVTTGAGVWKFTAPTSGYYRIGGTFLTTGAANLALYKNGSNQVYLGTHGATINAISSVTIQLNANDYIQVFPDATTTPANIASGAYQCLLSIEKVQGPNAIGPVETVACKYGDTSGVTFTNGATVVTKFTVKDFDTHNAYNTTTGIFTAPVAGTYRFDSKLYFNGFAASTADSTIQANYDIDGAGEFLTVIYYANSTGTRTHTVVCTGLLKLNAQQQVRFVETHNLGATPAATSNTGYAYFSAQRIGF